MAVYEIERRVAAPPDVAWPVVADVVGYADVAPNLSRAEVLEGEGAGMRRRCWDTRGRGWNETCTVWEEGRRYSFSVDTSDYPYPFARMAGTWSVDDAAGGSVIRMLFDYEPKYGPLGRLADRLFVRGKFEAVSRKLLDNWERRIEHARDARAP